MSVRSAHGETVRRGKIKISSGLSISQCADLIVASPFVAACHVLPVRQLSLPQLRTTASYQSGNICSILINWRKVPLPLYISTAIDYGARRLRRALASLAETLFQYLCISQISPEWHRTCRAHVSFFSGL